MLVKLIQNINNLNEFLFAPIDKIIGNLPFADWAIDAICDSIHLIPFLFFVFLIIEILESYYADKINDTLKRTGKGSVIVGALAAIFPQCGFSVIASSLYVDKIITRGTLIAVYLSTSDESIPILLATPSKSYLIIPIVGLKLFIGILMGYFIEFALPEKKQTDSNATQNVEEHIEEGCCKHDLEHGSRREIIVHPILHTINIWGFILTITLVLNYSLTNIEITNFINGGKLLQPIFASFIGLIPNCAISIGLTMMLIKGTISFGAVISGLLANAGLGLLVLLKNNDFKDTLKIIFILLLISIVSGLTINLMY